MSNATLFVTALVTTFAHVLVIITTPVINIFYAFILMRGCISALRCYGTNSAFASLYNRAIMSESLFVDFYFMIQTKTVTTAGWPLGIGLGFYLLAKLINNSYKEDPFTTLLRGMAYAAITIAHILIMIAF